MTKPTKQQLSMCNSLSYQYEKIYRIAIDFFTSYFNLKEPRKGQIQLDEDECSEENFHYESPTISMRELLWIKNLVNLQSSGIRTERLQLIKEEQATLGEFRFIQRAHRLDGKTDDDETLLQIEMFGMVFNFKLNFF